MLIGANGQLGQAIRHAHLPEGFVLHTYGHQECDLADPASVRFAVQGLKPDLIINLAAMTAVDKCETEVDAARAANFQGPANLAAQCLTLDIPLIQISTDYVFDGKATTPYLEDEPMAPANIYGESKMMGEEAIRHTLPFHVILRISSVFSEYGSNLLTRTLHTIDSKDEMKSVTDQTTCPTYAPDIADVVLAMGAAILRGKVDGFGTFHYCGLEPTTRFDFTREVISAYAPFSGRNPALLPALSSDFPGLAARPAYSVMNCDKLKRVYGLEQKSWKAGVKLAIEKLQKTI